MSHQQDIFEGGEADRWFQRNRDALETVTWDQDPICQAIAACDLHPKRIVDWGCSSGTRLALLCEHFAAHGTGVDPSAEAIANATSRWPHVTWQRACIADAPCYDHTMDLAVCSFVLHWVDRDRLFDTLAKMDNSVAIGGHLVIYDFDPAYPQRRHYHHLPEAGVCTWKTDYAAMFLATGLYRCIYRRGLAYKTGRAPRLEEQERSVISILERIDPQNIPEA